MSIADTIGLPRQTGNQNTTQVRAGRAGLPDIPRSSNEMRSAPSDVGASKRCAAILDHLVHEVMDLHVPVVSRHSVALLMIPLLWYPVASQASNFAERAFGVSVPAIWIQGVFSAFAIVVVIIALAPVNKLFAEKVRRLLVTANERIKRMGLSIHALAFGGRPADVLDTLCASTGSVLTLSLIRSILRWCRLAARMPLIALVFVLLGNGAIWIRTNDFSNGLASITPPWEMIPGALMLAILLWFSFPSKSALKSLESTTDNFDELEGRTLKSIGEFFDSPAGLAIIYWELGKQTKKVLGRADIHPEGWSNHLHGVVEQLRMPSSVQKTRGFSAD